MSDRPEYVSLWDQGPFQVTVLYRHLYKGGNKSKKAFKHTLRCVIPGGLLHSACLGKINGLNLLGKLTREEVGCHFMVVIDQIVRADVYPSKSDEGNIQGFKEDQDIPF